MKGIEDNSMVDKYITSLNNLNASISFYINVLIKL